MTVIVLIKRADCFKYPQLRINSSSAGIWKHASQ